MIELHSLVPKLLPLLLLLAILFTIKSKPIIHKSSFPYFLFATLYLMLTTAHLFMESNPIITKYDFNLIGLCLIGFVVNKDNIRPLKTLFISVLVLNSLICSYEIGVSYYVQFHPEVWIVPYTRFIAPPPYHFPIPRRLVGEIYFYRPHGLFSSIHLSAFANTFLLIYSYLKAKQAGIRVGLNRNAFWLWMFICSSCVAIASGTIQYWVSAFVFFMLESRRAFFRNMIGVICIVVLVVVSYERFYSFSSINDDASMVKIVLDSVKYLFTIDNYRFFLGGLSIADFSNYVLESDANRVDDFGLIRFIFQFGVVGFAIFQCQLLYGFYRCEGRKAKRCFLAIYLAFTLNLIHVYNAFSLIGGLAFAVTPFLLNEIFSDPSDSYV